MDYFIEESIDMGVHLLSITETSRLLAIYDSLSKSRSISVKMSLGLPLLRELSSAGPLKVVHWSLYSGILAYSHTSGYTIGSMLAQVMSAVVGEDDVNSNASINDISDISKDEDDGPVEKIIRLTHNQDLSNTAGSMILPPEGCAPVMWGKVLLDKIYVK